MRILQLASNRFAALNVPPRMHVRSGVKEKRKGGNARVVGVDEGNVVDGKEPSEAKGDHGRERGGEENEPKDEEEDGVE